MPGEARRLLAALRRLTPRAGNREAHALSHYVCSEPHNSPVAPTGFYGHGAYSMMSEDASC